VQKEHNPKSQHKLAENQRLNDLLFAQERNLKLYGQQRLVHHCQRIILEAQDSMVYV